MKLRQFLITYLLGAVLSWFLISGWTYAYWPREMFSSPREQSAFSSGYASVMSIVWPAGLPITWFLTAYSERGWKPVWDMTYSTGKGGENK
jgi:hypothetical protein